MNLEVPSNLGVVDLDWLASVGNLRQFGRGTAGPVSYLLGKSGWFGARAIQYKDAFPDFSSALNMFPDTNWRAVVIADLLSSGRASAEEVFNRGQESALIRQRRAGLNAFFGFVKDWGVQPTRFRSGNVWTEPDAGSATVPAPWESRRQPLSSLTPAPIGGIALAGAGGAIRDLGEIEGFRLNEATGALELLARLSPADAPGRSCLDDLVVVFRAVYQANGPSISIDPDPRNPMGPQMLVVPDEVTKDTWVEFVLLECDRIMKSYCLGADNISKRPIVSAIAGYDALRDLQLADASTPSWERFWIVPARCRLVGSGTATPHLLEVPLEVRTHRSAWQNGELVDVEAEPSPSAGAFTSWFTLNYDAIGREARIQAPADSGLAGSLDVFAELKKIAKFTAVAEYCRDRGIPLPAWLSVVRHPPSPTLLRNPSVCPRRQHEGDRRPARTPVGDDHRTLCAG